MPLTALSAFVRRAFPGFIASKWQALCCWIRAPLRASEAELKVCQTLHQALFLGGIEGPTLLMFGLGISALGFVFGIAMYTHLRNLPVHESMLEISELDLRNLQQRIY